MLQSGSDERFLERFGEQPRSHRVPVGDAELHVLQWGEDGKKPVLMVHGMRAHARWFSPVGPALAPRYRALSLDLRGHGESSHSPPYGQAMYAHDIVALIDALGLERPILVGHSMGAGVVTRAAALLGKRLAALVLVDAGLGPPPRPQAPDGSPGRGGWSRALPGEGDAPERESGVFDTWEEARSRFRLRPGDSVASSELLDHLARHALQLLPDGRYRWRFDPNLWLRAQRNQPPLEDGNVRCPVVSIYGAESPILRRTDPRTVGERFPSAPWTAVEILQGAHHHVFLDQPETFNALLLRYLDAAPHPPKGTR
jgi:pimeloyl-ACP methyl ester carboxylesterase